MEPTNKSNSINLGLYLGGVLSLILVLVYAVNLDLFIEWWFSVFYFSLSLLVLSQPNVPKTTMEGLFLLKRPLFNYFITIALGTAISTVIGIVIFNVYRSRGRYAPQ